MSYETIDQWREEFGRLKACHEALAGKDLSAAYEARKPHFENYVRAVVAQHGEHRVNTVLGHTVRAKPWDGRFTDEVKAWADRQSPFEQPPGIDRPPRDYRELITDAHPVIVNQVCRVMLRMEQEKAQNAKNRGDAR